MLSKAYLCKVTIDHNRVMGEVLSDFPVLLKLHGAYLQGLKEDKLFFEMPTAEATILLTHEMVSFDPVTGELQAWVWVARLSGMQDTYICVGSGDTGATPRKMAQNTLAWHGQLNAGGLSKFEQAVTVEAWVHCDLYAAETVQPLVSKWAIDSNFAKFSAFDASRTNGLDCFGFYGAIFDGRYIYFCPIRSTINRLSVHSNVLRYDTHQEFSDPQSYQAFDARGISDLNTVCYYGAAFDGRYVIFIPRDDGKAYHSRILRYDTHSDFSDRASWEAYDIGLAHSHQSSIFDGRYLYLCPGYSSNEDIPLGEHHRSGKIIRMDSSGDFKDKSTYRVFDTQQIEPEAACFDGGVFDGRYIYFVPLSTGVALRHDTRGDFGAACDWSRSGFIRRVAAGRWYVGGLFDGIYVYFVPFGHSRVVRYDTRDAFSNDTSWGFHDVAGTSGLNAGGFDGAFFDGRYIYLVPYIQQEEPGTVTQEQQNQFHAHFVRYDTKGKFNDFTSWEGYDAETTDGLHTVGYNGGAFDGRYFYAAPTWDGMSEKWHCRVLRADTVGTGASFSLRYCDLGHNGGLCASVPGPTFIVNTNRGPVSVAGHQALSAGWHYLVGVYDGRSIKLFVDGAMVAERVGAGELVPNDTPITLGRLENGSTQFTGTIHMARVSDIARNYEWINTCYHNLVKPNSLVCMVEPQSAVPSVFGEV